MKEALHVQMILSADDFNRDGGLEVPCCWITLTKGREEEAILTDLLTSNDMGPQYCMAMNSNVCTSSSILLKWWQVIFRAHIHNREPIFVLTADCLCHTVQMAGVETI